MDPGLQPQRTALAWQRTCLVVYLGAIGVGFAALRHGAPLVSAPALIAAIVVSVIGVRWIPRGGERRPESGGVWRLLVGMVAIVVLLALLGIALSARPLALHLL